MKKPHRPSPVIPRLAAIALLGAALLAGGCDGGGSSSILIPPLSRVVISLGADTTVVADTLNVGLQLQFDATAYDLSGNPVPGLPFIWRSTLPVVAAVNRSGRVLGISEGTSLVLVDIGGVADTVDMLVLPGTTGWELQNSNWTAPLNDVYFDADGRSGWAVGDGGAILSTRNAGLTWTREESNTLFNLNAVWFTDADSGWAVGNAGMAVHTTNGGATWTPHPTGASENLNDVYFAYPDTGWAVGNSGAILRTTNFGASWQKQNPVLPPLHAVAFAGTRNGWAVGDGGTILGTTDRGVTWNLEPSLTSNSLRGVVRRSEFVAFAAGYGGVAPRTTNVLNVPTWELVNTGGSNQLEDVFFTSNVTGYAVGFNGTSMVLRSDDAGLNWTAQNVPAAIVVRSVFFVDGLRGWIVGDAGRIFHTASGGN